MKQWKVRSVQEKDLTVYAKKFQSILNQMERDNFDFTVESTGPSPILVDGEMKFLALVTGSRDQIEKPEKMMVGGPVFSGPKLVVSEEK